MSYAVPRMYECFFAVLRMAYAVLRMSKCFFAVPDSLHGFSPQKHICSVPAVDTLHVQCFKSRDPPWRCNGAEKQTQEFRTAFLTTFPKFVFPEAIHRFSSLPFLLENPRRYKTGRGGGGVYLRNDLTGLAVVDK